MDNIIVSTIDAPLDYLLRYHLHTQCRALEFSFVFPVSGLNLMQV
jgi:hypothetical protein